MTRRGVGQRARFTRVIKDHVLAEPICAYCGGLATVIDHILPIALGGTNDLANLTPACRDCNHEKHAMTVDEWKTWRQAAGLPWPPLRYGDKVWPQLQERILAHSRQHLCDGKHYREELIWQERNG